MAFGGVEMGSNNAQDALRPITNGRKIGSTISHKTATGMSMVAVAVLLMILEKITVQKAKMITSNIGVTAIFLS